MSAPKAAPKLALLIGINYRGTSSELNGCINDVKNIRSYLINQLKYKPEHIVMMTEDGPKDLIPTRANILYQINDLILNSYFHKSQEIFFHYSGHGTYTRDRNGDEDDGHDENICPLDYNSGLISDDKLYSMFRKLRRECRCICLFDCCHSGTIMDLKFQYKNGFKNHIENSNARCKGNIIMISGCRDDQTSADAWINRDWSGAMTASFLKTMKDKKNKTNCQELLSGMRTYLKNNNYKQVPQLCCNRKINPDTIFCSNVQADENAFIKI